MLEIASLQVLTMSPISLSVESGECVIVGGASGSGKSVFLRAIADLDPAGGEVLLDGQSRGAMSGPEWRKLVRYVAAEPGWWSDQAMEHFSDLDYARSMVERLDLRDDILTRPLSTLSTGERQRLAVARGLEDRPKVLLFDEPTGALDGLATARVESLIKEARLNGSHIILVTHDNEQASRIGGRRYQISDRGLEPMS